MVLILSWHRVVLILFIRIKTVTQYSSSLLPSPLRFVSKYYCVWIKTGIRSVPTPECRNAKDSCLYPDTTLLGVPFLDIPAKDIYPRSIMPNVPITAHCNIKVWIHQYSNNREQNILQLLLVTTKRLILITCTVSLMGWFALMWITLLLILINWKPFLFDTSPHVQCTVV